MHDRIAGSLAALMLLACTHSDGYLTPPIATLGPFSGGPDVQLTFNADQDYWPAWTQDGRGILYSFVTPGSTASHRCLGILPAAGGSRIWEMCDNRAVRNDTVSSFTAFALDSTGRLLLVEAVSHTGITASFPYHVRLLLTDTAAPYVRTTLDTIPVNGDSIGGPVAVSWLSDLRWTGPTSFIALGQQFGSRNSNGVCGIFICIDSMFGQNGIVVTGRISGGRATLSAVVGSDTATGYSLAENGSTVVFIGPTRNQLFKVPIGGGPRRLVGAVTAEITDGLLGLTCRNETCLVAVTFADKPAQLISVSLSTGLAQVLRTTSAPLVATPIVSPTSNDVVVQIGGINGHIATRLNDPGSNLFLYKGIFP